MEESKCNVLELKTAEFLERVYRQGLHELIVTSPDRGMSGKFDETSLRSVKTAGRIMLTFAREAAPTEDSLSFVFDETDPMGLRGGLQSIFTDTDTAWCMIDDVTSLWPGDPWSRKAVYTADESVRIA